LQAVPNTLDSSCPSSFRFATPGLGSFTNGAAPGDLGNARQKNNGKDNPDGLCLPLSTITLNHRIKLDTELLEYVCLENDKSRAHFLGN
jgi:hypothetical protein